MSIYAVIDTNVLVSAFLTKYQDAATLQVIQRMYTQEIIPVYSDSILAEYRDVLHRSKFKFPEKLINEFLSFITEFGIKTTPKDNHIILPDMKDVPFYEIVAESTNDSINRYLITGNKKHFPEKAFIVSAREMIDILNAL